MKINCSCGKQIFDSTDGLPNKAHILPDQDWFFVLDAIDAAIENTGPSPSDKTAACMAIRALITQKTRSAWQCTSCGALYLDDHKGQLQHFVAAKEYPKDLFSARSNEKRL